MYKNRSRGFTLIELLVVIAIIGILSAVVLAALNTARSKGQDAAIMSDLDSIRVQAELYYSDNGNSYGSDNQTWVQAGGCTATANTMWEDPTIQSAIAGADSTNGTAKLVACASTATSYVAVASLVAANGGTAYQCVDSNGKAETVTTAAFPAAAISQCP